jgi:hypothetical protein
VIRNPRVYAGPLMVSVAFLLQAFANTNPVFAVCLLVLAAFAMLMALWPRLILTPDGVTVVNVRVHKLTWDEIDGVDVRTGRGTVNLVFRTGAGELRALAMRGSSWGGYFNARESVERVAAEIEEEQRRWTVQVRPATA